MGFRTTTPSPFSAITPASKDARVIVFRASRSDTSATLKAILPGDASIVSIVRQGSVASDAGTTATVTIAATNDAGSVSSGTDDVKTSGAVTGFVTMSGTPNLQPMPLRGDIQIKATYAESGTASNTGGPWNYVITYVR